MLSAYSGNIQYFIKSLVELSTSYILTTELKMFSINDVLEL